MRDLQAALDAVPANPTEETFIAFLDACVAGRDGIAPSTRASYETLINTHVRPREGTGQRPPDAGDASAGRAPRP